MGRPETISSDGFARNVGDVDGDGVKDFTTSAPTKEISGANAGRIYVYSSKGGKLIWSADGKPGDQLGLGIEGAGDVDKDGIPDVVAGAPGAGRAYVYSGRDGEGPPHARWRRTRATASGVTSRRPETSTTTATPTSSSAPRAAMPRDRAPGAAYVYSGKDGRLLLTLTGEREQDAFGSTVAGSSSPAGTLLVVGAPGAGPGKHGRTYVYDGLTAKPKFVIESDETGQALGAMFVSVVGDVDGDRYPDVYASDFSNAANGPQTGRIYVHSGASGRRLLTLTGETAGEGFGIGPASAGDVDGDGRDDLIVGSWQYAKAAISGRAGLPLLGEGRPPRRDDHLPDSGDTFGFDAVGLGDVDGDGTLDFLITSAWSGVKGFHSGRIFVISSGIHPKAG